jgi:hypothetical protein
MDCPKCGFEMREAGVECPRCGVVIAKFGKRTAITPPPAASVRGNVRRRAEGGIGEWLGELLFHVKPDADSLDFSLRAACAGIFFVWGILFVFSSVNRPAFGYGFWHLINLPFHEAGHIFFRPFGRFVTSLGGTLGQFLMPLVCMGVFLVKTRDTFAAGFSLWWLGESMIDIAPYIDDARRLTMPLLGGNTGETSPYGFHDWEYILTEAGLLRFDHTIAVLTHGMGVVLILLTFVWWGIVLHRYRMNAG